MMQLRQTNVVQSLAQVPTQETMDEVSDDQANVFVDQASHEVQHLEEDVLDPTNGADDAGDRHRVADYVGQEQQMMGLPDDVPEETRDEVQQAADEADAFRDDGFAGDQRTQGEALDDVTRDDQDVMPELPHLAEELVHDAAREMNVAVFDGLGLAGVSVQVGQRYGVPHVSAQQIAGGCGRGRGGDRVSLRQVAQLFGFRGILRKNVALFLSITFLTD